MLIKAAAIWLAIAAAAVANGALRETVITPRLGAYRGHVISTVLLCLVIFGASAVSIQWLGPGTIRSAVLIGATWLTFTILFEFVAGHYLFGNPWEKLLADYNVLKGRVWLLVLLSTFAAPIWAFWWKG